MTKQQFIAASRDGQDVYVDLESSHAAAHLVETPDLLGLIKEVLATTDIGHDDNIYLDKDFGRIIGKTAVVQTGPNDDIFYAKRVNRDTYSRFVRHREPEMTTYVTVVLHKQPNAKYALWSAWIGQAVPQVPGDPHATPDSRKFWENHALAWYGQAIQDGTSRSDCPW